MPHNGRILDVAHGQNANANWDINSVHSEVEPVTFMAAPRGYGHS